MLAAPVWTLFELQTFYLSPVIDGLLIPRQTSRRVPTLIRHSRAQRNVYTSLHRRNCLWWYACVSWGQCGNTLDKLLRVQEASRLFSLHTWWHLLLIFNGVYKFWHLFHWSAHAVVRLSSFKQAIFTLIKMTIKQKPIIKGIRTLDLLIIRQSRLPLSHQGIANVGFNLKNTIGRIVIYASKFVQNR